METRVSVVIPCFNAAPFLRQTIESALNQSQAPCEVLVIDDGSTDESPAIARSYGLPVRVISQVNMGESAARNRGIEEAIGEWIAFLDADDLWRPNKLKKQLAVVGPEVVCVHTNYEIFGSYCHTHDLSAIAPRHRYSLESFFLGRSPLGQSTLLVPKWLPARFPAWTRYAEDAIYFVEVSRLGQMKLVPEPLVALRRHTSSQSAAPGIAAHWHATFEQWLRINAHALDSQHVESLRENARPTRPSGLPRLLSESAGRVPAATPLPGGFPSSRCCPTAAESQDSSPLALRCTSPVG